MPPFRFCRPATELRAKLDAYAQARAATVVAETAFRERHALKDDALEDLVDRYREELHDLPDTDPGGGLVLPEHAAVRTGKHE